MTKDIERVLLSQEEIQAKVAEIGKQITADFADKNPIFIGVLKGCFIFMADLMRNVDIPCSMDFILVEDILDSGVTLNYLRNYLRVRAPASISIVTLLDKPARRKADVYADYSCFEVPDAFVVGYGLDYNERYRNLPYIGILKAEVYS